jgi:hypothetical protein
MRDEFLRLRKPSQQPNAPIVESDPILDETTTECSYPFLITSDMRSMSDHQYLPLYHGLLPDSRDPTVAPEVIKASLNLLREAWSSFFPGSIPNSVALVQALSGLTPDQFHEHMSAIIVKGGWVYCEDAGQQSSRLFHPHMCRIIAHARFKAIEASIPRRKNALRNSVDKKSLIAKAVPTLVALHIDPLTENPVGVFRMNQSLVEGNQFKYRDAYDFVHNINGSWVSTETLGLNCRRGTNDELTTPSGKEKDGFAEFNTTTGEKIKMAIRQLTSDVSGFSGSKVTRGTTYMNGSTNDPEMDAAHGRSKADWEVESDELRTVIASTAHSADTVEPSTTPYKLSEVKLSEVNKNISTPQGSKVSFVNATITDVDFGSQGTEPTEPTVHMSEDDSMLPSPRAKIRLRATNPTFELPDNIPDLFDSTGELVPIRNVDQLIEVLTHNKLLLQGTERFNLIKELKPFLFNRGISIAILSKSYEVFHKRCNEKGEDEPIGYYTGTLKRMCAEREALFAELPLLTEQQLERLSGMYQKSQGNAKKLYRMGHHAMVGRLLDQFACSQQHFDRALSVELQRVEVLSGQGRAAYAQGGEHTAHSGSAAVQNNSNELGLPLSGGFAELKEF